MYVTTQQSALLTSETIATHNAYARDGVLRPARQGRKSVPSLWTIPQVLGIGAGRLLRSYGLRGEPIRETVRAIGGQSVSDVERTLEGRTVLVVVPGVGVLSELVSRAQFDQLAAETLSEAGCTTIGVDVERLWVRLHECVAEHEANGWEPVEETNQCN